MYIKCQKSYICSVDLSLSGGYVLGTHMVAAGNMPNVNITSWDSPPASLPFIAMICFEKIAYKSYYLIECNILFLSIYLHYIWESLFVVCPSFMQKVKNRVFLCIYVNSLWGRTVGCGEWIEKKSAENSYLIMYLSSN